MKWRAWGRANIHHPGYGGDSPISADLYHPLLYVLGETLLQRLREHWDLFSLVGGLGEALQRARLHHRLAEAHHRVGHLDVDFGEDLPHVVHHAVEVELAGAQHHVFARLFHSRREEGVGLVDLAQRVEHLRQLRRVDW